MNLPLFEELPYRNTTIAIFTTQAEILALLDKYDIKDHAWISFRDTKTLKFILHGKGYQLGVPKIQALKKIRNSEKIIAVDEKIAYRMFFWALKSILELAYFNVLELDRLLLGYSLTEINGKLLTVSEAIQQNPNYLLPEADKIL